MNGKGSKRRPQSVPSDVFQSNWETIFGKGKEDADSREGQHRRDNQEPGQEVQEADSICHKSSSE